MNPAPHMSPLDQARLLKGLGLSLSDALSFDFKTDICLDTMTSHEGSFQDHTKTIEDFGFYGELLFDKSPVLLGMSKLIIQTLTCFLLGAQDTLKQDSPKKLLFAESFVAHELIEHITDYVAKLGHRMVFQKSETDLNLFHPFHPDDEVFAYLLMCKINQEPTGAISLCFLKESPKLS